MKKRRVKIISIVIFAIVFFVFLSLPKPLSLPTTPIPSQPPSSKHFFSSLLNKSLPTTLIAVGDVMLGRFCNVQMLKNKDFKYPFLKTADFISSADITFGNLEAPMVEKCPTTETGMVFCARPESIEGLKHAGFDILSVANNHILNHGQNGLEQTQNLLSKNGIQSSDSNNVTMKQFNNLRFGFLSFDLLTYPPPRLAVFGEAGQIFQLSQTVDVLIVSLHWGNEYQKQPSEWQKVLAHRIIESGAKIIIGHHPHVTQPVEEYDNGLIFYSLGNFVFDQPWSEETKKGQIARIVFEGKEIKSYELFPIYIQNYCQPTFRN